VKHCYDDRRIEKVRIIINRIRPDSSASKPNPIL
jgi:hypothetical protein